MIYRFTIISDEVDDFVREIQIDPEATFYDFHEAILKSVGYTNDQMTSFFICDDDWEKGKEVTLEEMDDTTASLLLSRRGISCCRRILSMSSHPEKHLRGRIQKMRTPSSPEAAGDLLSHKQWHPSGKQSPHAGRAYPSRRHVHTSGWSDGGRCCLSAGFPRFSCQITPSSCTTRISISTFIGYICQFYTRYWLCKPSIFTH